MTAPRGRPYLPSNGTEGEAFIMGWSGQCQRDRSMREGVPPELVDPETESCSILDASFRGSVAEWIVGDYGLPTCTAFLPAGQAVPVPRCEHTGDMFEGGEQ